MEGRYLTENYSFRISYYSYEIQPFYGSGNGDSPRRWGVRLRTERGLVTISQVGWREGVKEEIPNLLPYHAKALPKTIFIFLFKPVITEANRSALQRLMDDFSS